MFCVEFRCCIRYIGLVRNFSRFFQKFYFYFLNIRIQLSINNVCSITIYDLSPTLWQRKDLLFVEVLRVLVEEVEEIHFEVVLVFELFLT